MPEKRQVKCSSYSFTVPKDAEEVTGNKLYKFDAGFFHQARRQVPPKQQRKSERIHFMGTSLRRQDVHYTYEDYCSWETNERYELIEGLPYMMSPAPSVAHQAIVRELFGVFYNYLKGKPCQVFVSPIDVRLNADRGDDTVVQPDLLVVCDMGKIEKNSIKGAPDLVIEVISPSSEKIDSNYKLGKYLKAGVRECWIVEPDESSLRIYAKDEYGAETMQSFGVDDTVAVDIFPGLFVPLGEVFEAVSGFRFSDRPECG
jgi:Uma2 family endonuclease